MNEWKKFAISPFNSLKIFIAYFYHPYYSLIFHKMQVMYFFLEYCDGKWALSKDKLLSLINTDRWSKVRSLYTKPEIK